MFAEQRKRLVEWVREQLIGPTGTKQAIELHNILPTERFPCGAIYPASRWGDGVDPSSEADDVIDDARAARAMPTAGEEGAEPAIIRRYIPPSSIGFSFFVSGNDIRFQVLCSASRYEGYQRGERGRFINEWQRIPMASDGEDAKDFGCPVDNTSTREPVFGGAAHVDVLWRRHGGGWIVTVTLCNTQELDQDAQHYSVDRTKKTLFEAGLRCVIDAGEIGTYPRVDRNLLDDEEQEIELQYSQRHIYAVGHGAAIDWQLKNGKVVELHSNMLPVVEVPQVTADTGVGNEPALSLQRLSQFAAEHETLLGDLTTFVTDYERWVSERAASFRALSDDDKPAASRIVTRMQQAVKRMHCSLKLLRSDADARTAFALANQAILDQMRQYDARQGKSRPMETYQWRPFQLGFLLTVLESAANEDSDFRDTVDLIWFPTGGGKTEAYFGLIAFQIVLRRLRFPTSGGGTAVLMRYTLRLLTRDQFLRAARLICALELIRRKHDDLGPKPITVGIWVGNATSPNSFKAARECVATARQGGKRPPLVIDECPWCGQGFEATTNYVCTSAQFRFVCHNSDCAFGATRNGCLPCNVVDEALYAEPPTLVVATLDKFARLAWDERASAFFGADACRPPELIIQDELHLIAGALGSIAGLYEAALDTVIQLRGLYPKYVASTATIRMAEKQVHRLYGRDVAVFPPPGLSCDDSWFARTLPLDQRPGRMYLGYLAPLLNRQQCLGPLAAALLRAPDAVFRGQEDEPALLDAWWTQVVYHGSLRGVGNSHTVFDGQVRDFMRLLAPDGTPNVPRSTSRIEELTSLQTAEQNAEIFSRLRVPHSDDGYLDAVLATNMVSVGLDVARLALMVVNGQPLTTAEYIQASSRVGRSDVPGLVFINYYRDQARSLSHYEDFRPYHDAFYRFVEPTSVTPYTYQARLRAIHAALVIVVRHGRTGLRDNSAAGRFDPAQEAVARAIEKLARRCRLAATDDIDAVDQHLKTLAAEWTNEAARCRDCRRQLDYQVPDQDTGRDRLLYNHDDKIRGLWPTLQSMRNVEGTALFKVI